MRTLLRFLLLFALLPLGAQIPSLRFDPVPGTYTQERTLSLRASGYREIAWRFADHQGPWLPWTGSLDLGALPGEIRNYRILVQLTGEAGTKSQQEYKYTIDLSQNYEKFRPNTGLNPAETPARPRVLSPASGSYSYRPYLVVLNPSGKPLYWRVRSANQIVGSGIYTGPLELPGGTSLSVDVGFSENIPDTSILYSAEEENFPEDLPIPGFYTQDLRWPSPGSRGSWKYNLGERSYIPWAEDLSLEVQKGILTLHMLQAVSPSGEVFRIPLILDGRKKDLPRGEILPGIPPEMKILSPPDALTFLEAEGQTPIPYAGTIPLLRTTGTLTLKSRYQDGTESVPVVLTPELWAGYFLPPQVKLNPRGLEIIPVTGLTALYSQGRDQVRNPGLDSPKLKGTTLIPPVSEGETYTGSFRFTWVDSKGRLGQSSETQTLTIDRLAPPSPVIAVEADTLSLAAQEGELWYRISQENPGDQREFTQYAGPVKFPVIRKDGVDRFTITAFSRDQQGNESPQVVKKINIDRRTPGILGMEGLLDGGLTKLERLVLEPKLIGEILEVRYTLTLDGTEPGDPRDKGEVYSGPVVVELAPDEDRYLQTKWNVKTPQGWVYDQGWSFTQRVDRTMPGSPVLDRPWTDALVEEESYVLNGRGAGPQDRLYYSMGILQSPGDPLGPEGKPWPGSLTLRKSLGREVRLRLTALDPAGNPRAMPEIRVYFQSRSPSVPRFKDPRTQVSGSYILELTPAGGTVRYTLTRDGTSPGFPDDQSPLYTGPVFLQNLTDRPELVRIRAVRITEGGLSRVFSPVQEVLIHPESIDQGNQTTRLVVTGVPETGLSNQNLILKVTSPGRWKYEISSGLQEPAPLTSFSRDFPDTLEISVPEGQEKSFILVAGVPGGQMNTYRFRLDRKAPPAPELEVRRTNTGFDIKLPPPGGNSIFWNWEYTDGPTGESRRGEGGTLTSLSLPSGTWGDFRWRAWVEDPAGNRSPLTLGDAVWANATGFFAPGTDRGGDGSPENPWTHLDQLQELGTGWTHAVFFGGEYSLDRKLDLKDLKISGGYDPESHRLEPQARTTVFRLGVTGGFLLRGESSWEGINLLGSSQSQGPLVEFQSSRFQWTNVILESEGETPMAYFNKSLGKWTDSKISSYSRGSARLLEFDESDVAFQNLNLGQSGAETALGFILRNSYVQIEDSILELADNDNSWLIRSENSTVDTINSRFVLSNPREFGRMAVLETSLWKDLGSRLEINARAHATALYGESSAFDWTGTSLTILSPSQANVTGIELRGINTARFTKGIWSAGRGTILAGQKPANWTWTEMSVQGWR